MAVSNIAEATIVMVDDNTDEIFLTRRRVAREGIVNRFVSEKKPELLFQSLNELCHLGTERESFVILLDINMPRQNGFETLRQIRAHPVYRDTPVIMLSASKTEQDVRDAEELACDGYLTKPFDSEAFFSELQNISRIRTKLFCDPDVSRSVTRDALEEQVGNAAPVTSV